MMNTSLTLLIAAALVPAAVGEETQAAGGGQSHESVVRMAERIQKAILTLPEYGLFDDLRFNIRNIRDYTVTLKGYASRPILRSSAERVTKGIEGVEKVVNEIEVLPWSRNDDDIRIRTYAAVYGHTALFRYNPNRGSPIWLSPARLAAGGITNDPPPGNHPIKIIVKNGNVTLTGWVANMGDKTIAGLQANSVPFAFAVDNQLMIAEETRKQR